MKKRIPIFIPHFGCTHACIYCNQRQITGISEIIRPDKIHEIIDSHLSTLNTDSDIEIAFFGGNFTALNISLQKEYLRIAQSYIKEGKVDGIRFSTRPDDIYKEYIDLYKDYGVRCIELGAQSLDKDVLSYSNRGHSVKDVETASYIIKQSGLKLGLQMMIGLPKDTYKKSINTAKRIIDLGADETRIYPTLVIENTILADIYRNGEYDVLSIEEAAQTTADLLVLFEENNVKVIRVGLHPSEGLLNHSAYLAGPFHPSFREIAESLIWKKIFEIEFLHNLVPHKRTNKSLKIFLASKQLNVGIGYNATNRLMLKNCYKEVKFYTDTNLSKRDFTYIEY